MFHQATEPKHPRYSRILTKILSFCSILTFSFKAISHGTVAWIIFGKHKLPKGSALLSRFDPIFLGYKMHPVMGISLFLKHCFSIPHLICGAGWLKNTYFHNFRQKCKQFQSNLKVTPNSSILVRISNSSIVKSMIIL